MASGYLSVSGGASGYPAVVGQVASGAASVSVSATRRRRPRSPAWTRRRARRGELAIVAHRFDLNMGRAERAASWPTGPRKLERAAAPSGATTARPDRPSSARRETPLILACRKGDVAACSAILQKPSASATLDQCDCDGLTALMHASLMLRAQAGIATDAESTLTMADDYERIVRGLLHRGADPSCVDKHGSNALHHATFLGHARIVAVLLSTPRPSDINTQRANGESALSVAAFRGHASVTALLLEAGAAVNQQGPRGGSALMLAASQGHAAVVRKLLDFGADSSLRAASGATALKLAKSGKHDGVVAMLEAHVSTGGGGGATTAAAEASAAAATTAAGGEAEPAEASAANEPAGDEHRSPRVSSASRLRREVKHAGDGVGGGDNGNGNAGMSRQQVRDMTAASRAARAASEQAAAAEAAYKAATEAARIAAAEVRSAAARRQSLELERKRQAQAEAAAERVAMAAAGAAMKATNRAANAAEARAATMRRAAFVSQQRHRRRIWEEEQQRTHEQQQQRTHRPSATKFGAGAGAGAGRWASAPWATARHRDGAASGGRAAFGDDAAAELPLEALVKHVLHHELCPHRCLGLASDAPKDAVRKRFLLLALRLHPDKADHPRAPDAFAVMQRAVNAMHKRTAG